MPEKTLIDLSLERLQSLQTEIANLFPPPYDFPSVDGNVAHLVADLIDKLEILKKKGTLSIE